RRGWTAIAATGDAAGAANELARGRPVIALIQEKPGRNHYVVVVGWDGDRVTVHDPARGPSRVLTAARFDAEWRKADRWMLILLRAAASTAAVADDTVSSDHLQHASGACGALVDEAVAKAAGDRALARTLLARATAECPGAAAGWRELAGLDALDADW